MRSDTRILMIWSISRIFYWTSISRVIFILFRARISNLGGISHRACVPYWTSISIRTSINLLWLFNCWTIKNRRNIPDRRSFSDVCSRHWLLNDLFSVIIVDRVFIRFIAVNTLGQLVYFFFEHFHFLFFIIFRIIWNIMQTKFSLLHFELTLEQFDSPLGN